MHSYTVGKEEIDIVFNYLPSSPTNHRSNSLEKGAGRIPSMIMQTLHLLLDYNLPPLAAVETPRVHLSGNQFNIEKEGFKDLPSSKDVEQDLVIFNKKSMFFGGVNSIMKENNSLIAVADERRDGVIAAG